MEAFGSAAIGTIPVMRQMKLLRAETANTRDTIIASIYEIVNGSLPFSFLENSQVGEGRGCTLGFEDIFRTLQTSGTSQ